LFFSGIARKRGLKKISLFLLSKLIEKVARGLATLKPCKNLQKTMFRLEGVDIVALINLSNFLFLSLFFFRGGK
jgi:hypothetical protein